MAFLPTTASRPNSVTARICLFAAIAALATSACSVAKPPDGDLTTTQVRVIDSVVTTPSWHLLADSVTIYRIEVITPAMKDTVAEVLPPFPIVVGDSQAIGLRLGPVRADAPERQLFRYHLRSGRLETWPLPADLWPYFHDVVPSPDGRYFAYVAFDDSGTAAVVRELNSGREVVRAVPGGGCDCDVDRNHARWFAPDSFEIAVAHLDTGEGWRIVAGRASTQRVTVIPVDKEPDWHPVGAPR